MLWNWMRQCYSVVQFVARVYTQDASLRRLELLKQTLPHSLQRTLGWKWIHAVSRPSLIFVVPATLQRSHLLKLAWKKQRASNQQKEVKLQVKLPRLRSHNESEALIDLDSDAAADPPSSTSRTQAISDTHDADSETDQEETVIAHPRRCS